MAANSATADIDAHSSPSVPQPKASTILIVANSHIHDLPTELLCKVFQLIHAELSKRHDPTNLTLLPVHLQKVCRRWYDIVTNYPPLWSIIHFHDCDFDRAGMIAAYVAHAQRLSVDGAYERNDQMISFKEVLGSLEEEVLPRLHELWIGFDGITELAEEQLNLMKDLEALHLVFGDFLPQSQLLGNYRIELPSLRRISTHNIDDLDWGSCVFNQLESLHLKESTPTPNKTIHTWTRILSQFPFLQDVIFDLDNSVVDFDADEVPDEDPVPHSSPAITLTALRSLALLSIQPYHLGHVFSAVEMPDLRSLKLSANYWPRPITEDWSFFNNFRAPWCLETLSLNDWVETEGLLTRIITSSQSSTSLIHLELHRYDSEPPPSEFGIPLSLLPVLRAVHADSLYEVVRLRLVCRSIKQVVLPLEATGLRRGLPRSAFASHKKWVRWLRRKVELRIDPERPVFGQYYKSWRHMMRQRPLRNQRWQA